MYLLKKRKFNYSDFTVFSKLLTAACPQSLTSLLIISLSTSSCLPSHHGVCDFT